MLLIWSRDNWYQRRLTPKNIWPQGHLTPRTFDPKDIWPKDIWHQGHLTPRTFDPKDIWPQGHFTQGHLIQGRWKISEVTLSVFSWIKWDVHVTSILLLNKMLWIAPTTCDLAKNNYWNIYTYIFEKPFDYIFAWKIKTNKPN